MKTLAEKTDFQEQRQTHAATQIDAYYSPASEQTKPPDPPWAKEVHHALYCRDNSRQEVESLNRIIEVLQKKLEKWHKRAEENEQVFESKHQKYAPELTVYEFELIGWEWQKKNPQEYMRWQSDTERDRRPEEL